jgi:hypothetical protein
MYVVLHLFLMCSLNVLYSDGVVLNVLYSDGVVQGHSPDMPSYTFSHFSGAFVTTFIYFVIYCMYVPCSSHFSSFFFFIWFTSFV